jgi:hypothetical protein
MLAPSKVGTVTLAARLDATPPAAAPLTPRVGSWNPLETPADGGPQPWRRDGVQRAREETWEDGVEENGNGSRAARGPLPSWAGGPRGSVEKVEWPAASAPASPPQQAERAKVRTPPPGGYLPPSGAFSARDSGLARGQLVHPASERVSDAAVPATRVVPNAAATKAKPGAGDATLLADLPFDVPKSLPGWLIAAGSAAALAGFLLPWSENVPFASGFGYLDTWGLATPSHGLVLLMTVGVLAMAIFPNRVPAWLRTGVCGLVLGALLFGLVWPYLLDGFGALIGTLAEAAAAIFLMVGGLLALRPARHADDEPAV